MISPAIKPRVAFKPISRGLIVAARNSVNKVQESTQTISKGLNKNEKFAMNYVEFFGSKKTTKILKKNLKSIKESLMSTFSMAKILKKKVAEMSKGGGMGSLLGGVAGFLGKGLMGGLLGKLVLGTLIGLATGGIGYLLYSKSKEFFQFLNEKRDQFAPIIEGIMLRYAEKTTLGSGMTGFTDELSSNVDLGVQDLLKENSDMNRDDAIVKVVQGQIDAIQKQIDEEQIKLNATTNFAERTELKTGISRLKAGQNFLRTGSKYDNPVSSFFFDRAIGGIAVPPGYSKMTSDKRVNSVKGFVENSPKSLDTLEFEILKASNLRHGENKARFYEDALNYINAKRNNNEKTFDVLPESINPDLIRTGNRQEYADRYPELLNYKPSSNVKAKNLNIIQGRGRGSGAKNNSNGGETLTSSKPDSGIIDIAFYSPLNEDSAMERGSSRNLYNLYIG